LYKGNFSQFTKYYKKSEKNPLGNGAFGVVYEYYNIKNTD
jgi:hypothetical protein